MPDNRNVALPATPDALESRPPAEAGARRQIRIASPENMIRLVPILLGFHPEASVVILGVKPPRGTIKVCLRYSLDGLTAPDVAAHNVGQAIKVLTSQSCSLAVAVGYGPDARIAPFIELLQEQAGNHDVHLPELLRVEDNRYWSYICTNPACCPPEGTPFDPAPDPEPSELLTAGVLANREALAGLVAPLKGAAGQSMLRATRTAEAQAAELVEQARASADHSTSHYPIAPTGIMAIQQAITRYRNEENPVSHDEAAWLLVSLRDMWVRDDAWSRMEGDHRQAHLRLWLDLTRLARPGYVAAPASLLAFVAWQSGNGALANVALDRALTDDPDYKMARIMRRTIDCGLDPSKSKVPMTPEQIAEAYTSGQRKLPRTRSQMAGNTQELQRMVIYLSTSRKQPVR
jgi:hypothetical protein